MKNMSRYSVLVIGLKPRRFRRRDDDGIFINEGDSFFGYSGQHQSGGFLDLWFNRTLDFNNRVTFGKITRIEPSQGIGKIYVTKLGRFYVEEKV